MRSTSTASGRRGRGAANAADRSRASTRARLPACTVTVPDQGSKPSFTTSTRCVPVFILGSANGVCPTGVPSMRTVAPEGSDAISAAPVAGAVRESARFRDGAGASAERSTVSVVGA